MVAPTRFPSGVTNSSPGTLFGNMGQLDPTKFHTFFDDFDRFFAITAATTVNPTGVADYSLAQTFTGTPTNSVIQSDGGVLALVTGTADNDNSFVRWKGYNATTVIAETFRWAAAKPLWFKIRAKISDVIESDFIAGLAISTQDLLANTDGIFFLKADGTATVNLIARKNSVDTTIATGVMVADTYVELGFYYDPRASVPSLTSYVNGVAIASSTVMTNMPDDEELTISFGIQNGEAVSKTLSVDYILAAKGR